MKPKRDGRVPAGASGRIDFLVPDEEYARVAESQRVYIRGLADRIDRGEALTEEMARVFAAGILRAWADQIPDQPKKKPGQAPKFDHGSVALQFVADRLVNPDRTKEAGYALLAEANDVSIESIKSAIEKYGPAAEALLDGKLIKK